VVESGTVDEFGVSYTLYTHRSTGAELMSVRAPADDNKVFAVSLRTPPTDSSGLPHILEHSVLCGSQRFPVKDPFVRLLRGSLHTFLNAFTYPDRTVYPTASQVGPGRELCVCVCVCVCACVCAFVCVCVCVCSAVWLWGVYARVHGKKLMSDEARQTDNA
jgi:hypothetical protein